jgi:hypothetical protein
MKTDHERAIEIFHKELMTHPFFELVTFKKVTGLPFVYLTPKENITTKEIEDTLRVSAARAMKGKRLTLAMSFVRKDQALYVYRVRFLVPQRKMFCCGNLCDDCIRFTQP